MKKPILERRVFFELVKIHILGRCFRALLNKHVEFAFKCCYFLSGDVISKTGWYFHLQSPARIIQNGAFKST